MRTERQHPQQRHLKALTPIGCEWQIAPADQANLIKQMDVLRRQLHRQLMDAVRIKTHGLFRAGHALDPRDLVQNRQDIGQQSGVVGRIVGKHADQRHHRLGIALAQCRDQVQHARRRRPAQHRLHLARQHFALAKRNRLIQQTERVAHTAVGGARDVRQGIVLNLTGFTHHQFRQVAADLLLGQALEAELQATRQHRDRDFLRIRGGEQELHMLGRLFEGF